MRPRCVYRCRRAGPERARGPACLAIATSTRLVSIVRSRRVLRATAGVVGK